jgi:HK97 family phage portal protein
MIINPITYLRRMFAPSQDNRLAMLAQYFAGQGVGIDPTKDGYKRNTAVYGAVNQIASNVARCPIVCYSTTGKDRIELPFAHPLVRSLATPNVMYSGLKLREMLMMDWLLTGQAYLYDVQGGMTSLDRVPHTLIRRMPSHMKLVMNAQNTAIDHYEYKTTDTEKPTSYAPENVLRLYFPDPDSDTGAMSPLVACSQSVKLDNAARVWNSSLMENGGRPSMFVSVDKDTTATPEQLGAWREMLQKFTGSVNAGKIFFTGNTPFKIDRADLSPADVHWVEAMRISMRDVSTAFGVPSVLLNDAENSTYANFATAVRVFQTMTVIPLLDMLTAELTGFLSPKFGGNLEVSYDADKMPALDESTSEKWARIEAATYITVNEKRAANGYEEVPEGNVILVGASTIPLGTELDTTDDMPDDEDDESEAPREAVEDLETRDGDTSAVQYWKRFERSRTPFYAAWEKRYREEFKREMVAVIRAAKQAQTPATLEYAALNAVDSRLASWEKLLRALYVDVADTFARPTFEALSGKQRAASNPWDAAVMAWIANNAAEKVREPIGTTRDQIRKELAAGVAEGEHVVKLTKRLESLYITKIIPNRARLIARTEVIGASNLGSLEGARSTGLDLEKKWLATPQPMRTRHTHMVAGSKPPIPLDEAFVVGGQRLMHPGDGSLGAGAKEVCNCRCAMTYKRVTE